MTRQAGLAAAAICLALLTACGSETGKTAAPTDASPTPSASATASPTAPAPGDLSSAALATLLPTTKQMEYLLGYPLEMEAREELTQLHEGAAVDAEAGQVGFYRTPGGTDEEQPVDRGGYVALSAFASEADAIQFLDTNPSYDDDRETDPADGYLEVFDLSEVSDEGSGYVYRESGEPPTQHTQGIARIGRVVIEVALFHGPDANLIAQTRQAVDDFRARLPRSGSPAATAVPE